MLIHFKRNQKHLCHFKVWQACMESPVKDIIYNYEKNNQRKHVSWFWKYIEINQSTNNWIFIPVNAMRFATMPLGFDKTSKTWKNNGCFSCWPLQHMTPSYLINWEIAFLKLYKTSSFKLNSKPFDNICL